MLTEFTDAYVNARSKIEAEFLENIPASYEAILRVAIKHIREELGDVYGLPDIDRIHKIDDGDYQGILLFVIAEEGYQPDTYWVTSVRYGSCSVCDTLESIVGYEDEIDDERASQLWILGLHMLQRMKEI
jgi:hypothetical protein